MTTMDDRPLSETLQRCLSTFEEKWRQWNQHSADPRPSASEHYLEAENLLSQGNPDLKERFVADLLYTEISQRSQRLNESPSPHEYSSDPPISNFSNAIELAFKKFREPAQTEYDRMPSVGQNSQPSDAIPLQLGRYKIIRQLGRGGFGCVLLADDPQFNRKVAIKVAINAHGEDLLANREVQAVGRLEYEGIVRVYEIARDGPPEAPTYVVMQFIDGPTLESRLRTSPYELSEATELVLGIATAVGKAHLDGIFHLDLKPANILLDRDGKPWVTDFGLAVHEQSIANHGARGTRGYMSPNQWNGGMAGSQDDIWSIGAVFYQTLTQRLPFGHERIQSQDLELAFESIAEDTGITPEAKNILRKSLLVTAEDRYQSLDELSADLRSLQQKLQVGPDTEQKNRARQRERSAIAKLHKDRPDDAIETLRESIAIYSGNAYANYLLGLSYLMTGRIVSGIQSLLHSLELDRNHPWTHYALAETFNILGHRQRASEHVNQALLHAPSRAIHDLAAEILQDGSTDSEDAVELTDEIDSSRKSMIREAVRSVFVQDRAKRVELLHWTAFLPPWRYFRRAPLLHTTAFAVISCALILAAQIPEWILTEPNPHPWAHHERAVQQVVIWILIWMGLYFSFVVPKIVERTYHQLLPAITGWTEAEFREFYIAQSSHLLGRTCSKSVDDTSIAEAIKENKWQIIPVVLMFFFLLYFQYVCARDQETPVTFAQCVRYISYVMEAYALTWVVSLSVFGLAFIPRFRIVPTRFFIGMPEATSLKPIGTLYLQITLLNIIGYCVFLFQHYVFHTQVTNWYVSVSYIFICSTTLLLDMFVCHVLVSLMISKVKTQKVVEYSYHLETAFENAMRSPSTESFKRLDERERFMKRLRQLDVFGLSRIDAATLTAVVFLFATSTLIYSLFVWNGWWLFPPPVK